MNILRFIWSLLDPVGNDEVNKKHDYKIDMRAWRTGKDGKISMKSYYFKKLFQHYK